MEGDNITYSYSNVTKNAKLIPGYVAYEGVYQVIGQLTSFIGENCKNVYYKAQENFEAVQTTGDVDGMIMEYSGNATSAPGLFEADSKFTNDVLYSGNPTLRWEASFGSVKWNIEE